MTALEHEEQLIGFLQWVVKGMSPAFKDASWAQCLKLSLLLILRSGLMEVNKKAVPPKVRHTATSLMELANNRAVHQIEVHIAMALDEFNCIKTCSGQMYLKCTPVHRSYRLLQDFLLENQHIVVSKDALGSRSGRGFDTSAINVGASTARSPELQSWQNVVRVVACLIEVEDPHNDAPADSFWSLAVFYLKLETGEEDDVPFVEPPPGDATTVLGSLPLDWEEYEDRDDIILADRPQDEVRLPRAVSASLRFIDSLIVSCFQNEDLPSAASYCDAFGALLSHKHTTSAVSSSLFVGATRLFAHCHMYDDAVRAGMTALKQLHGLTCDLRTAAEVVELVREAARNV